MYKEMFHMYMKMFIEYRGILIQTHRKNPKKGPKTKEKRLKITKKSTQKETKKTKENQ